MYIYIHTYINILVYIYIDIHVYTYVYRFMNIYIHGWIENVDRYNLLVRHPLLDMHLQVYTYIHI